jgi:hypothetical protein
MMTLLFMAMFGTALVLCMLPVVVFGLMLETCQNRVQGGGQVAVDPRPRSARLPVDTLRIAA